MCHGRDGGAGGRGEPVAWRRRGLGVEGRGCAAAVAGGSGRGSGLPSGAGDGRLGLGLGGLLLKEVAGPLKARSTCFSWVPGGRGGEAAAVGAESGRALGCGGEGWRTGWWEGGLCERFVLRWLLLPIFKRQAGKARPSGVYL